MPRARARHTRPCCHRRSRSPGQRSEGPLIQGDAIDSLSRPLTSMILLSLARPFVAELTRPSIEDAGWFGLVGRRFPHGTAQRIARIDTCRHPTPRSSPFSSGRRRCRGSGSPRRNLQRRSSLQECHTGQAGHTHLPHRAAANSPESWELRPAHGRHGHCAGFSSESESTGAFVALDTHAPYRDREGTGSLVIPEPAPVRSRPGGGARAAGAAETSNHITRSFQ